MRPGKSRSQLCRPLFANLEGSNLVGAKLRGANLRNANLRNVNAGYCDFHSADLREANLYGAILYPAETIGAKFYGAKFRPDSDAAEYSQTAQEEICRRMRITPHSVAYKKLQRINGWTGEFRDSSPSPEIVRRKFQRHTRLDLFIGEIRD